MSSIQDIQKKTVNKSSMKVLLIYREEEKRKTDRILRLFEELKILVEVIPVKSYEDVRGTIEDHFPSFFAPTGFANGMQVAVPQATKPTHVALLSAFAPGWIDFLAGFSVGSRVPFLVYGKEAAKSVPDVFAFCFKILKSEAELKKYVEAEFAAYKRMDADRGTNAARDALLKMGVPVSEKSLVQCVCDGCLREVLFFLAAGFSPDTRSKTGVPLLNLAARNGDRYLVRYLYLAGAQLNLQADDRGTSALIDSVMGKYYDLIRDLIKAGADLDIKSKDEQTALVVATGIGDALIVEALLKAGANPDIPDAMGMSARKYANLFHKNTLVPLFETYAPIKD